MTILKGKGRRTTKMNVIFSMGKEVPNIGLKIFLQKSSYQLNEGRKTGFEGTFFPHTSGSIGPIISKNNWAHP